MCRFFFTTIEISGRLYSTLHILSQKHADAWLIESITTPGLFLRFDIGAVANGIENQLGTSPFGRISRF